MVDASLAAIGLPSGATNCAYPSISPSAAATPGTARTCAITDSGSGLRVAPAPAPSWAAPRTWKSILL